MTPQGFRKLALALPEARAGSHLGHADFRVGRRVFATLGYPDVSAAVLLLKPQQQAEAIARAPRVFRRLKGSWGAKGSTEVRLRGATPRSLEPALRDAWSNVAPRALLVRAAPRISSELRRAYRRYLGIALRLPGASEATSYGTPAVKVRGKLLSRWRTEAEGALAIRCDFLDRQILLQADPDTFFVTDHYLNYPMVLVRLERIAAAALADLTERAWRTVAPRRIC